MKTIRDIPCAEGFQIALIILPLCIACVVGAARAAPFPAAPIQKPAVETHKDQSKVRVVAWADPTQKPWLCEQVRKAVAQYGREMVERYARARGYSEKKIEAAMTCLKEKKT